MFQIEFVEVVWYLDTAHPGCRMQKPLKKGGKKVVQGGKRSVAANKHGKGGTATKKGEIILDFQGFKLENAHSMWWFLELSIAGRT